MVYIEHKTPSNYRERHKDWYYGTFRDVAHQMGLIGERLFWLDCESKAKFIDSLNPFQNMFPFENVEQWIKGIFKSHYSRNYLNTYDEWALQACKFFEKIEGEIGNKVNEARQAFDKVLNDARLKLQLQLNNLKGLTEGFKLDLKELDSAKTKAFNLINDLEQRVRGLKSLAEQYRVELRDLESAKKRAFDKIDELDQRLRKLEGQAFKLPILEEIKKYV